MRVKETDLERKLINVYNTHGVKAFLDVCANLLSVKESSDFNKKMQVNGEVCEVVLTVLTKRYLQHRGITSQCIHSLVLKDLHHKDSDFRTEIDFTIVSPFVCVTGECKSFAGDITIKDKCTLSRSTMNADVAKQINLHSKTLTPYLESLALPNSKGVPRPPLEAFCFLYSNGRVQDMRSKASRVEFPVVTIKNLYAYYDSVFGKHTTRMCDYSKSCNVFMKMANSLSLRREHQKYLNY